MAVLWHPVQTRDLTCDSGIQATAAREHPQKGAHIRHGGQSGAAFAGGLHLADSLNRGLTGRFQGDKGMG